ncbi:MAG: RHS repeat-associated core domain-containing protein [Polyangiaceae bacterium]
MDDAGNVSHTLEVLETLRLNRTTYDVGANDYVRSAASETVYAGGVARVFSAPGLPSTTSSDLHVYLMLGDHLGSTSMIIDKATSEVVEASLHDPYGRLESDYRPTRWQTFREDYKFTGKEEDAEVGLVYFGARYYSPNLSRFISPDPLTIMAGMAGPNPYAYVSGHVTMSTDPWGLQETSSGIQHDAGSFNAPAGWSGNSSSYIAVQGPDAPSMSAAGENAAATDVTAFLSYIAIGYERAHPRGATNMFTAANGAAVFTVAGHSIQVDRVQYFVFRDTLNGMFGGVAGGDLHKALMTNGTYAGMFGEPPSSDPQRDISEQVARWGPALITIAGEAAPLLRGLISTTRTALIAQFSRWSAARAAANALPRSGPIARSMGAMSRAEQLARKLGMNTNSPTTRQALNSLDMTVKTFVGLFRKGSVLRELPGEVLEMTVEDALQHSSKVKKLLIDGRWAK